MPKNKYSTSVVIPAYNGQQYLEENLPVVLKLGADEVIVVDDASTDGSVEVVKKFKGIKLIENKINLRFPKSVNAGFKAATGDIVFLLNQDVTPDKDLLKCTLPHFEDPKVFAVTFNEQNRSWAKAEFKKGFLEFTNGSRDDQVHESFWASGASAAFRKSMWNELGGLDPIFSPGYSEDLDLGWRSHLAGYKILWDPKCKVEHVTESAFNKAFAPRKLRQIKERNYLLAHWNNLKGWQWIQHIFYLKLRLLKYPGYIVPVGMALWRKLVS